ncbi:MAG: NAD(P)-dependent oxidoreductase [Pseudomonadota bacterium]
MVTQYKRILLTGAAGMLGSYLRPRLRTCCDHLRVSDIKAIDQNDDNANDEIVTCRLEDGPAMIRLVDGVDAIVHLGAACDYDTANALTALLEPNVVGAYNLYEAARLHGVKRIVFASSHHVIGRYRQSETIDASAAPRPDSLYAVTKLFGENVARLYYDRYQIETVCLRIGSCFAEPTDRRMLATWFSFDDLYRAVAAALEAPAVDFSILFGVSRNKRVFWSNVGVEHLGYVPEDDADNWRAQIDIGASPIDPDISTWHGGAFGRPED